MKRLPKSIKRHIRWEKAKIRKRALDTGKKKELVEDIYRKFLKF